MKLIAKKQMYTAAPDTTVVLFLDEEQAAHISETIPKELDFITATLDLSFVRGKPGEVMFLPFRNNPNIFICGVGKQKNTTPEALRKSAGNCMLSARKRKIREFHVIIPLLQSMDENEVITAIAEGFYLANYSFSKYKSKQNNSEADIDTVYIYTFSEKAPALLRETAIICENSLLCRNLVNDTSDNSNPAGISKAAKKIAKQHGISCSILGRKDMEKLNMGLMCAVSRGAHNPPQCIILKYTGKPGHKHTLGLVGKGVTFDSGGINIKPSGNIETMRSDMAGAAACLYAVKTAAELKLRVNIVAAIPCVENMITSSSYRPGDIFRSYNGKTVEIGNTDAEGRLILADALAYIIDRYKPDVIVDIATLTGACVVCFGELVAGLLSTSDELSENLFNAGEKSGERLWRLPLYKEYDEDIKSDIADICNISPKKQAGSIIGAVFLKHFVQKTPWAHIDIAGTAWYSKRRGYLPKNATGYGVRLLTEFLKNYSQ
jgi:leucyl aminopeptidase